MVRDCPTSLSHLLPNALSIFHFLALRLMSRAKITKLGVGLQQARPRHAAKFQPDRTNCLRDMRYQSFSLFGLGGVTPVPKFTKRRDDLPPTPVYHPAKFHRTVSTHTADIRYKKNLRTNKVTNTETVNDIFQACLSACGIITSQFRVTDTTTARCQKQQKANG